MSLYEILAQIIAIVALFFLLSSYQVDNKKKFLFRGLVSDILYGLGYLLLGAKTAIATSLIAVVKQYIFFNGERKNKKVSVITLLLIEMVILIAGLFTFENVYSILPIIVCMTYTYGQWQSNLLTSYSMGLLSGSLMAIYNFEVGAYVAIISSILEFISSVIGIVKEAKRRKKKMEYICKVGTREEVEKAWEYQLSINPGDNKWVIWRDRALSRIDKGTCICYYGILNGEIICEATAHLDKRNIDDSEDLIDEHTAYLSAFRTKDIYQGQGYFSKLYRFLEEDLKQRGYTKLTIGVEPQETKNKAIYSKWGYTNYIRTSTEEYPPENENAKPEIVTVDYYYKEI